MDKPRLRVLHRADKIVLLPLKSTKDSFFTRNMDLRQRMCAAKIRPMVRRALHAYQPRRRVFEMTRMDHYVCVSLRSKQILNDRCVSRLIGRSLRVFRNHPSFLFRVDDLAMLGYEGI